MNDNDLIELILSALPDSKEIKIALISLLEFPAQEWAR